MLRNAVLALLYCLSPASPQDLPFRVQTKIVEVPVLVHDPRGANIEGLAAKDFLILDNGVPRDPISLLDFGIGLAPVSLVVAIQSPGKSKQAPAEIRRIAGMIQPLVTAARGEVAVVSIDRDIHWLQDFTSSDDRIRSAIRKIQLPGPPAAARLFDAIAEAAERLRPRRGRKMLLLISQDNDSGSKLKLAQALELVERENIQIFVVHDSAAAKSADAGQAEPVKSLAIATGGSDYGPSHRERIENAIESLGIEVHTQYVLSFPQRDTTPGLHRLDVSVAGRPGLPSPLAARLLGRVAPDSQATIVTARFCPPE